MVVCSVSPPHYCFSAVFTLDTQPRCKKIEPFHLDNTMQRQMTVIALPCQNKRKEMSWRTRKCWWIEFNLMVVCRFSPHYCFSAVFKWRTWPHNLHVTTLSLSTWTSWRKDKWLLLSQDHAKKVFFLNPKKQKRNVLADAQVSMNQILSDSDMPFLSSLLILSCFQSEEYAHTTYM